MINRIKEFRKAKGYRQEDIAEALGVSRQTIIAIETNKYNPSLGLAMRLARYLHTTVEELFGVSRRCLLYYHCTYQFFQEIRVSKSSELEYNRK